MARRPIAFVSAVALACVICLLLASARVSVAWAADAGLQAGQAGEAGQTASTTPATQATSIAKPTKKQLKAFKKAGRDFSMDLFGRCVAAKGKNANVCVAPLSVMNVMAFTANGAKGKTRAQMSAALAGKMSLARLNKDLGWYNARLVNSAKAKMVNANSLWYQDDETLAIKKKFLAIGKKYYGAEVRPVDFGDKQTTTDINSWVFQKTNGMIERIVDSLDSSMRIAIVNAQSFDAKWKVPYEKSSVHKAKFTQANGKVRKVKMMYGTEQRYICGGNVTGFIKPYAKGYSFVALLPAKGISLKKYVASLDGDAFGKLIAGATTQPVRTGLPKFSVSYSNEAMEQQLRAMGMRLAFSLKADFGKMAVDKTGRLYIDQVVHKTKVIVDEQGTKAAAVTGAFLKAGAAFPVKMETVILNRPFVYAIIDNATKLPLFIGTVNTVS